MTKIPSMPNMATVDALARVLDFYSVNGSVYVRRMPTFGGRVIGPLESLFRSKFGRAVQLSALARIPERVAGASAGNKAAWTWRDCVVSAEYGNFARLRDSTFHGQTRITGGGLPTMAFGAQWEQVVPGDLVLGIWTSQPCVGRVRYQHHVPHRSRRTRLTRGVLANCGYWVDFAPYSELSAWDDTYSDFHMVTIPFDPTVPRTYYVWQFRFGLDPWLDLSQSTSIVYVAAHYPGRPDPPLNEYAGMPFESVKIPAGYLETLWDAEDPYPWIPN